MFVTAGLVIVLGILQWQNAKNGALFLASTSGGFTITQNFLYRYFPTILVVLYGMGWSWIDLDVKRLEPWFQLARERGVDARKSLLLHYPVDFLPFVPFKAAKQRQWTVLCASTISVLVAWAVTPLQNGIFKENIVSIFTESGIHTINTTAENSAQVSEIGGSVLSTAYSILWLDQALPAFTTTEFAIAPFYAADTGPYPHSNQSLTARTVLYSTQLTCHNPSSVSLAQGSVSFNDGHGCNAQDMIYFPDTEDSRRFSTEFFGYQDEATVENSLQLGGCPLESSHLFLAIWKLAGAGPPNFQNATNATALFCEPSYYEQPVEATVTLPGYSVVSIIPAGEKRTISPARFNATQFENLVAAGVPLGSMRQDISQTTTLHQDSRLLNMSIVVPAANMIGFAVGSSHYVPEAYLEPRNLEAALDKAYKLLFALTMQSTMPRIGNEVENGTRHFVLRAVSLVQIFAILSQAFLFIVLVSTCYLLYVLGNRPNLLQRNPDTLAEVMTLSHDPHVRQLFRRCDTFDERQLATELAPYFFRLGSAFQSETPGIRICAFAEQAALNEEKSVAKLPRTSKEKSWAQPIEFQAIVGYPVMMTIAFVIVGLVYLHQKSSADNGLSLPSRNSVVQQIILNLLPISIATLLEPFWVLLNRLVCLLRPMEELQKGNAPASRSLLLRYTSLPPQLVVWRAFRARHYFLALLSCTALLANLLTVALSGLFNITETFREQRTSLQPLYQPQLIPENISSFTTGILGNYNQYDAFYVASANFSSETGLPAWTAPHDFFLPMEMPTRLPIDGSYVYNVQTTGFGAELDCQHLTSSSSPASMSLSFNPDAGLANFITSHRQQDGSTVRCKPYFGELGTSPFATSNSDEDTWMKLYGKPVNHQALEVANLMLPANADPTSSQSSFCANLVVKGWVRASFPSAPISAKNNTKSKTESAQDSVMSMESTFLSCQPRLKTALFNITILPTGLITASHQLGPTSYELPAKANLSSVLNAVTEAFGGISNPYWHIDTIASDWGNDLIKQYTNSNAFLNVSLSPPAYETAASLTSEIFSRLFAIQMSLQTSQLVPVSSETPPIPATLSSLEQRVFLSEPLYRIALIILILDFVVSLIFYTRVVQRPFLPRLPTSIASQIAYFAESRVMDDMKRSGTDDLRELDRKGFRYSYGRYLGSDGWTHVGIERSPFVVNVDAEERRRRKGGKWGALRWRK